jgi:hypothetical protein
MVMVSAPIVVSIPKNVVRAKLASLKSTGIQQPIKTADVNQSSTLINLLMRPKRWVLLVIWILVYIFGFRTIRVWTVNQFGDYLSTIERVHSADTNFVSLSTREAFLTAVTIEKQDQLQRVQIFFGQYFLIGIGGLLLLSVRYSWVGILAVIHLFASLLNGVILWLLIFQNSDLLFVSEALQQFIIPVLSLGFIPLVYWLSTSGTSTTNRT